jgi:hypothetical protein
MAVTTMGIDGLDDLARLAALFTPEQFAKAQAAGMRYAARSFNRRGRINSIIVKGIAESYGITQQRISTDIRQPFVAPDGSFITVGFSKRAPTLNQFAIKPGTGHPPLGGRSPQPGRGRGKGWGRPNPARQPLTALQLRSEGRQPITGAFQAAGLNGNQLVFRRKRNGKLRGLYGPSIGSIFLGKTRTGESLRVRVREAVAAQYRTGFMRALMAGQRGYGAAALDMLAG